MKYIAEVDWDKQTGGNCCFGDSVQGLRYTLSFDKPAEFGGKGDFPSPCSIFFNGFAGCLLTTLLYAKERMRLEIKDLKVTVEANVKSTMVSGYSLESINAVIYVIIDNEVNRAKALRCGEFVK